MNTIFAAVMMIAPSASDTDVEHNAIRLSYYETIVECEQALEWIEEHQHALDRHLWCQSSR